VRVVTGGRGCGKSSFLAKATQMLLRSGTPTLFYFAGTAPETASVAAMLAALCHGLEKLLKSETITRTRGGGGVPVTMPTSYAALKSYVAQPPFVNSLSDHKARFTPLITSVID
jgi:tRNA(Met) C34 N-acetyltransferase TmcA